MSSEVQLKVRVPPELKKLVDADTRTNKEVVRSALWEHFGGKKKSALEAQKEHKRQRLQALDQERESLNETREQLLSQITSLDTKIDTMQSEDEAYHSACDELLADLEAKEINRLVPTLCEDVADTYGKEPETVWEDCKHRAAEQDRPLYNTRFMKPHEEKVLDVSDRELIADAWDGDDT